MTDISWGNKGPQNNTADWELGLMRSREAAKRREEGHELDLTSNLFGDVNEMFLNVLVIVAIRISRGSR